MPLVNAGSTPPPRTRQAATSKKPATPNPNKIREEREEALNGVFQMFSFGLTMANQWADAGAFAIHGPNVSRETVKLAEKYERVGSAIDALAHVGPFTAILGAVMPLALQLAANHKRIPAEKVAALGVKDPNILESEMRMEAQRQAFAYQAEVDRQRQELAEYEAWVEQQRTESVSRETVTVS